MKALIFAATLLAAPAYAENCAAYRDQVQNGLQLVQSVASAGMASAGLTVTAGMDTKTKREMNAINRRISEAITAYNEATKATMNGPGLPCQR